MSDLLDSLTINLDVSAHRASAYADELRDYLLSEDPDLKIERVRSDPRTQDLGATLVILLGTGATLAIARGIQRWIALRSTSKVVVSRGDAHVEVTNLPARRAEHLASELSELLARETELPGDIENVGE